MLFDDHGLLGQFFHFRVSDAEAITFVLLDLDRFHKLLCGGVSVVNHLDGLATQVAAQNGRLTRCEGGLVNVKFIGVHSTLHHRFAQAVGAGDKHDIPETGFRIQGEHNATGSGLTAHHLLDASRQGYLFVVKTVMDAIGNGAVIEQRGEDLLY